MNINTIMGNSKKYYSKEGIYFLILKNEIVYIGSTTNFEYRIQKHLKEKIFDSYSFFEVGKKLILGDKTLLEFENEMIIKYKPKYNKVIHKPKGFISKYDLKYYGLTTRFIKKNIFNISFQEYGKNIFYNLKDILFLLKK